MTKTLTLLLLCCIYFTTTRAQSDKDIYTCAQTKKRTANNLKARPTVADTREDQYDVKYVHLDLALSNINNRVQGLATTNAIVTAPSMSEYVFELIGAYTIDSLRFNGQLYTPASAGLLRTVTLPSALPAGTAFSVQVYYNGQPDFGPGFFTTGIRTETSPSWGAKVTYTLSEPFAARDWWPVKQSLQDKIDSSDVWLTVPAGLKAGSNGLLQAVTPMPGGKSRYEWKNRYPIDYYLISLAVSTYVDYSYYVHFDNSTDSMLVQNYVYDNPATLPFFKEQIDSTANMINYFSGLFGRYPFWNEKYGHCMSPLGGGMEHQTMTTLGNFETSLVAHELGHQWFGDHVTCGTWSDIWLNEGFASYTDYLFVDHFQAPIAGITKMNNIHSNVMSEPGGSVYCTDTTNEGRIFSGRLTYDKGAAVVHSLRFEANDDVLFYNALKTYQQVFAHGTATTAQFENFISSQYGRNMDTFFNQWVYGEGYPTYSATWNQNGNDIVVVLRQSTSMPASVALFHTPLELKFSSPQGDTTVRINNNAATSIYTFSWNKPMETMAVDPNNWIINRTGAITRDRSLTVQGYYDTNLFLIYPNPTKSSWTLEGLPTHCNLQLSDVSGRILWTGGNELKTSLPIDAAPYASGVYFLSIIKDGEVKHISKLQKL